MNKDVEAEVDLRKGDKRLLLAQKIESNLPEAFTIKVPIFKGGKPVEIECETYFNPDDLTCTLVSPEANDMTEQTKDGAIDTVIEGICKIAPDIAVLEI